MGPLSIFQGMALAVVAAPNASEHALREAMPISLAGYSLPAGTSGSPTFGFTAPSDPATALAPVPMNDAIELPRFTFRDGGVVEIGGSGLKFAWRF